MCLTCVWTENAKNAKKHQSLATAKATWTSLDVNGGPESTFHLRPSSHSKARVEPSGWNGREMGMTLYLACVADCDRGESQAEFRIPSS